MASCEDPAENGSLGNEWLALSGVKDDDYQLLRDPKPLNLDMAKLKTDKSAPWPLLVISFFISLFIGSQLGLVGQMLLSEISGQMNSNGRKDQHYRIKKGLPQSQKSSCIQPADGGPALNENFEPCTN
ncbi:putative Kunitz/Bovine pancreatic trypsin inhib [Prochlorococcus sp. MIT 0702]|uniref:hypothetical protein n=1 Tax=Prochlorococcus sp. MIT 0702 TaxID=1499503 RepID=UPI0005337F16|nr:putative Kunitz/Bovine pancreatic trypsin inhib [Prochlorococcus sp. MIT 0702]KGG28212.1 putative Kunitz/Bovine pancreatic trypsin inhib [Prochlorococcus sp. MIT 0701]KGG37263.1 putative Kunitz/Bovine pancreatic trypsin inhib [Prochlorococcus sp. MIT 0703]